MAEGQSRFMFGSEAPEALLERYGSPLYVYDARVLRARCREVRALLRHRPYRASYSMKANGNLRLLSIVAEEGLDADAMSPGEIQLLEAAGVPANRIVFIPNNVGAEELAFAVEREILCCLDSLCQLELFGRTFPGRPVSLRFNPGIGAGHDAKVVTAGPATKFGIAEDEARDAREIAARWGLQVIGVQQHIGSGFLDPSPYVEASRRLLEIASGFDALRFVDFGGGFGVPYREAGEHRLDLASLGSALDALLERWRTPSGEPVEARVEPGRYLVAECGALLGRVTAVKERGETVYAGTDLGFNVLSRPVIYGAYHRIALEGPGIASRETRSVTVVGNVCETGDILAKDRRLPAPIRGDVVIVGDAGAYGYSMSSCYNARMRPAEVLIQPDGSSTLIRRRETMSDLLTLFPGSVLPGWRGAQSGEPARSSGA